MTTSGADSETNQRLDRLETGQDDLRAGQEELRAGQEELRRTVTRIERNVESLRNDIGPLKASHARQGALHATAQICMDLGLEEIKVLAGREIAALARRGDTTGIPPNQLDSFIGADVIIEAADDDGETRYVAIEASFTADERDTDRAVRNAAFLTRFTGKPAYAVIAATRIDDRIAEIIESGKVHWRRLEGRDLQID